MKTIYEQYKEAYKILMELSRDYWTDEGHGNVEQAFIMALVAIQSKLDEHKPDKTHAFLSDAQLK